MKSEKIEALKTADEYLYNLENGIEEIANLIQEGNEIEGINKIVFVTNGIEYIIKVIELTKDIQKEKIEMDDLNEQLRQIVESLENEDYILLGDLLYYELNPVIKEIHEKIQLSI